MGKGEIACYEQFSFSHNVFKSLVLQTRKNQGLFGKGLTDPFSAYCDHSGGHKYIMRIDACALIWSILCHQFRPKCHTYVQFILLAEPHSSAGTL